MDNLAERIAKISAYQTLTLTHRGRKSGRSYEVVIWFVVDGDRIYLRAANANGQWARNVMANPKVSIRVGAESFAGTAHPVDAAGRAKVAKLAQSKYWYALPLILAARLLEAFGLIGENRPFEVEPE
jgi:deazaflavin-dependent oxidoreductase (nitroreductase family)